MIERLRETIDMTPDGQMKPPRPIGLTWPMRIGLGAALVAVLSAAAVGAAILLWIATFLVPIAIGAAVIAYAAFRFQLWRARRNGSVVGLNFPIRRTRP